MQKGNTVGEHETTVSEIFRVNGVGSSSFARRGEKVKFTKTWGIQAYKYRICN